ncbi:MAG: hypothetical protein ACRCYU_19630 [Nocardioides sp.]
MLKKTYAGVVRTKLVAGLVAVAVVGGLAGCSDSSEPKSNAKDVDTKSAEQSAEKASAAVDPANVSPANLPKVPEVKKAQGAIKDLTLGECATAAGKQTVQGEITSSARGKADYLVTVSWATGAGDVMGRGFAVLENVKPGATETFTITAKVKDGATQCVPGVTYGRVA